MRILLVNPAYDAGTEPEALLDSYDTLTGWGEALLAGGALEVTTLQRFSRDLDLERGGVRYLFRADGAGPRPRPWTRPRRLLAAARESRADVVHANGLVFPTLLWQLGRALPARAALLIQHHAGRPPRLEGVAGALRRVSWRRALRGAHGFLFTAADQAEPWRAAGLIGSEQRVRAIPESSRRVRHVRREDARLATGLKGRPQLLFVGHLVPQKDPRTVVEGFSRVSGSWPEAHLAFVYQKADLLAAVRESVARDPRLAGRVALLGTLRHDALPEVYGAADIFVSASLEEGSGYALIEALGAGLVPVVTDIPSFRALTAGGALGALWRPGDAQALAKAITQVASRPLPPQREAVLRHFEAELSWPAVGRQALALYREVVAEGRP